MSESATLDKAISQEQRDALDDADFGDPAGHRYPVRTQDDLDAAARLIGHAGSVDEQAAIKARLIAVAKRKGLTLPDAWQAELGKAVDAALRLFWPLTKVDATRREVWGILADETPDHAGEVFDYASSKPHFQAWSDAQAKATDGASLGNVRVMHNRIAAGKVIAMDFDDAGRIISLGVKVVDDNEWQKCIEGVYTGFSMGGGYGNRWPDSVNPRLKRYTALPVEVSLVDNPCIPGARFQVVKTDGTTELRKFAGAVEHEVEGDTQALPAPDADAASEQTGELVKAAGDGQEAPEDEQPVTPEAAAEELIEDAAADNDPTVAVPVDALQTLHNMIVALGAWCGADAAGLPSNPLAYLLQNAHATLCALGAQCSPGAQAAALALVADADGLTKAGARHSTADRGHIQEIHDRSAALGAQCGDMQKAADADTLTKADPPALDPELTTLLAKVASLDTALAEAVTAQSAQTAQVAGLRARIAELEAQPIPGGPLVMLGAAGPVEKQLGAGPAIPPESELIKALETVAHLDGLTPAQQAEFRRRIQLERYKAAQAGR